QVADFPHACESIAQTLEPGSARGVVEVGRDQRNVLQRLERLARKRPEFRVVAVHDEQALLREERARLEVSRHLMLKRAEAELPAVLVDAVDDFAARRDVELQARERVALAELEQQITSEYPIDEAVHGEVQRAERTAAYLLNVLQRGALLLGQRLRVAQQPQPGLGRAR